MSTRVPDILVERLAAGELPAAQAADVRRRLEAEPGGLARLDELRASDADVLARLPTARVVREVHARANERAPLPVRRPAWWVAAPVLAVAAAAVLVVRSPAPDVPGVEGSTTDDVRGKGTLAPKVFVHRRTETGDELLVDGATAATGDELQVGYASGGWSHGVLLSIDGRGTVTLHHPPTQGGTTLLKRRGEVLLPRAYALDDAPTFESFVFVVDDRPLDVFSVLDQAKRVGVGGPYNDRDGAPLSQTTFTLRKQP